jgi:hypothetical protein
MQQTLAAITPVLWSFLHLYLPMQGSIPVDWVEINSYKELLKSL